jgi:hypothetical protein
VSEHNYEADAIALISEEMRNRGFAVRTRHDSALWDIAVTEAAGRLRAASELLQARARIAELEQAGRAMVDAMGRCHICCGSLIVEDGPAYCEDCSGDCDEHEGPACPTIYELHETLSAVLAAPQA